MLKICMLIFFVAYSFDAVAAKGKVKGKQQSEETVIEEENIERELELPDGTKFREKIKRKKFRNKGSSNDGEVEVELGAAASATDFKGTFIGGWGDLGNSIVFDLELTLEDGSVSFVNDYFSGISGSYSGELEVSGASASITDFVVEEYGSSVMLSDGFETGQWRLFSKPSGTTVFTSVMPSASFPKPGSSIDFAGTLEMFLTFDNILNSDTGSLYLFPIEMQFTQTFTFVSEPSSVLLLQFGGLFLLFGRFAMSFRLIGFLDRNVGMKL